MAQQLIAGIGWVDVPTKRGDVTPDPKNPPRLGPVLTEPTPPIQIVPAQPKNPPRLGPVYEQLKGALPAQGQPLPAQPGGPGGRYSDDGNWYFPPMPENPREGAQAQVMPQPVWVGEGPAPAGGYGGISVGMGGAAPGGASIGTLPGSGGSNGYGGQWNPPGGASIGTLPGSGGSNGYGGQWNPMRPQRPGPVQKGTYPGNDQANLPYIAYLLRALTGG